MKQTYQHFGILGCGAWGTALALALRRAGRDVTIWAHDVAVAASVNAQHENTKYLPGITLDAQIKVTTELAAVAGCDALIVATPAQHVRSVLRLLFASIDPTATGAPVILAAKGIEQDTCLLLSDVVGVELPHHQVAVLSGPSFAIEVARGLPAALTLAMNNKPVGDELLQAMATPSFRLYLTDDVVGAQIGGAIKNVLAVATGIIAGRAMGENARAALMTRGLAEMMRLGTAMGGHPETLMGLSGLGDLVLTCSSLQSRNMSLGIALGQGKDLTAVLASRSSVTEGVYTAAAALKLAQKYDVAMPIVAAVDAVLNNKADIDAMIAGLLARPFKAEAQ